MRRNCYYSTQPMEEPPKGEHFLQVLDQLGGIDRLMFASDYPHWDWDAPDQAFPVNLPADVKSQIYYENAQRLYRLPESRA